jgi:hypothetical protein
MSSSRGSIVPLAAALGALSAGLPSAAHAAATPQPADITKPASQAPSKPANTLVSTGRDLLGFTVDARADGTIVAQHVSHASHASHYSGR